MRLTEFHRLVSDEFGLDSGKFLLHSHALARFGATPEDLLEAGEEPAKIWAALCDGFDVPKERRLGRDQ